MVKENLVIFVVAKILFFLSYLRIVVEFEINCLLGLGLFYLVYL